MLLNPKINIKNVSNKKNIKNVYTIQAENLNLNYLIGSTTKNLINRVTVSLQQ